MELAISRYCFDSQRAAVELLTRSVHQPEKTGAAGKIRCRNCHELITDRQQAATHNGSHIHNRTNPGGYSFDFACFQRAPGCGEVGPVSYEYSWFHGYSWQLAICKGCGEHLGWMFAGESWFYGLIIDRLVADDRLSI